MRNKYRLLHLEDNLLDAELVQARLTLDGLPAETRVVYTRDAFITALQTETFDAILADYVLPAFDGLSALALAREQRPELPFVFVTGELGEERAIETLQQGATDYVLKSRLARLRPAVQRAIDEAAERQARQRAEAAAQAEREWLRVTLASIGDAVIASDTAGRITFINPVAEQVTGWRQAEAIGQPVGRVFNIVNEVSRARVESPVEQVLREGVIAGLANHTVLIRRDGTELPIDDSGAPIRAAGGQLIGVVLVFRDITPRRQAEAARRQSEERYRSLVSATTAVVWVADPSGRFAEPQAPWEAFTGQPWPAQAGENWLGMVHGDDRATVQGQWQQALATQTVFSTSPRLWHAASQAYRHAAMRAVPVLEPTGAVREWVGTINDIHERIVAETAAAQAAERTARLQAVTAALSSALTPEDVFEVVLSQGIAAVAGAAGAVVLLSSRGDRLEVARIAQMSPDVLIQRFSLSDETPAADVIRSGEPVWITSQAMFSSRYPHLAEERAAHGYQASAYVPLMIGARAIGCLMASFVEARDFDPGDQGFLLTLGQQCAQALERARLYAAEQHARERATRLAAVTAALSQARSPAEVSEVVLNQGATLVGAAAATIISLSNDGSWLSRVDSTGYPEPFRETYQRYSLSTGGPAADAVLSGQAVWLESAAAYQARYPRLAEAIKAMPYEAAATVPLHYGGQVNGVLALSFTQVLEFSDDVRTFIIGLADNCAQALERARLFAQTQALNAELEERVRERTEALETAVDQLRAANTALEQQILERRQAEDRIRSSERRLQEAQHLAGLGSWRWDSQTGRVTWSEELASIYGEGPDVTQVSYESFLARVHPDDREPVRTRIAQADLDQRPFTLDFRIVRPDGSLRTLNAHGEVLVDAAGRVLGRSGTAQDITERKTIEEELRRLSNHLHAAREEERARIAREIHDELGGNMTGLKMTIMRLANSAPKLTTAEVVAQATAVAHDIDGTVQAIRRIATELRPAILDDFGLLAAIEWQLQEFQTRSHLDCQFTSQVDELGLPSEESTALFRVFQETLTNIARHAQATQVLVKLEKQDSPAGSQLVMRVQDNGRGITEQEAAESKSLGLLGMRERVRLIGGELDIRGQAGQGTIVMVRVPLAPPAS